MVVFSACHPNWFRMDPFIDGSSFILIQATIYYSTIYRALKMNIRPESMET